MINWKPQEKKAAVCFTIDDIHPSKGSDHYEAGGDLEKGNLGLVQWLLDRHPRLKVTLFTTANWREISPLPTRRLLAATPLREKFYLAKRWPKDKMNLERHPDFVDFLNTMKGAEIAFHGLYHVHKGLQIPVEFQNQKKEEFAVIIREMLRIFNDSGLQYVSGICPPGWNAPAPFVDQLINYGFEFIASARDIFTDISANAVNSMSGMRGVSLLYPERVRNSNMIHIPTNFQATSKMERARKIIDNSGILSIKAHIIKSAFGNIAADGVDQLYMNYLDLLFTQLESEYGDDLWWTSMGEISQYVKNNND